MNDLRSTIAARSDQMNSDDLIGGPRTIRVTKVEITQGADQPVSIYFEGDDGKPFKACKSMRRVLVTVWGPDGNAYVGRSMTLYRDAAVQFGGMAVGGIRISHMSHIEKPVTMALTATRAAKKPFTVKPLVAEAPAPVLDLELLTEDANAAASKGVAEYQAFWSGLTKAQREGLLPQHDGLKAMAKVADSEAEMQAANEPVDEVENV